MSIVRDSPAFRTAIHSRASVALQTLGHALRSLRAAPQLVIAVVILFALGIGANATLFDTIDRLILRAPPHVVSPEEVKRIYITQRDPLTGEVYPGQVFPFPDIDDLRDVPGFDAIAAYSDTEITVGRGEDASAHRAVLADAGYWHVLGTTPVVGRLFDAVDDAPGADPVAVIGYRYWQDRFGGSPAAIGATLNFGHGPYTIIGVAPRGMTTLDLERADVFLPLQVAGRHLRGGEQWVTSRQILFLRAVGRLSPGASAITAAEAATARHLAGRSDDIAANRYYAEASVVLGSLKWGDGLYRSGDARTYLLLSGVAAIVLLITILNVTNLLVGRAIRARRESAIRLALGISRGRHIAQTLAEGALLGFAGAGGAFLISYWLGSLLRARMIPLVAWDELGYSTTLWIFLGVLGVVVGIVSAVPAALRASRPDVITTLKGGGSATPGATNRLRPALSVVQAAGSVILLVCMGLFLRSANAVLNSDIGFAAGGLHTFTLIPDPGSISPAERQALLLAATDRLRHIPGVDEAAASTTNPFQSSIAVGIDVPGVDPLPQAASGGPYVNGVSEGYLRTMGIAILQGRDFAAADHDSGARVAIVGQTMARAMWGDEDPIGRCIHVGGAGRPCTTVIGIAADPHRSDLIGELETFQYWIPAESLESDILRVASVAVRVSSAEILTDIRRELVGLDSRIQRVDSFSYRDWIPVLARAQLTAATLFSVFGVLALIVAALGLYSVIAFDVTQRTREIGIRTALGAASSAVVHSVVGRGMWLASAGIVPGLLAAAVLSPRLEGLLHGVSPRDPVTMVLSAGVLLAVALFASWLPAVRAASVDPNIALRAE